MARGPTTDIMNGKNGQQIRFIPLSYDAEDSEASARRLVLALRPEWEDASSNKLEFVRFTEGITNTLLKAVNRRDGLSKEEADKEAILLRAYGHGTDLLIDRHRETQNHELLMRHGLAPELLARFDNGMMYRFVRGTVAHPEDLRKPPIYRAVARRLAQWHATVPCIPGRTGHSRRTSRTDGVIPAGEEEYQLAIDSIAPGKPSPNVWTVMQKWIFALPTDTEAQRKRQDDLQAELHYLVDRLSQRPGLGKNGLVFAHCDLLCGNVIVLPKGDSGDKTMESVTFIDYEYATPSPAAFDLANHFAEWGGFDCDFGVLPTRSQRREFVAEYVRAYGQTLRPGSGADGADLSPFPSSSSSFSSAASDSEPGFDEEFETARLVDEVDGFRGMPGFYWGIWSLIQATISDIDFDYASYAEIRLGEYYAWKAEIDGSRAASGKEMPFRERRWAQEE